MINLEKLNFKSILLPISWIFHSQRPIVSSALEYEVNDSYGSSFYVFSVSSWVKSFTNQHQVNSFRKVKDFLQSFLQQASDRGDVLKPCLVKSQSDEKSHKSILIGLYGARRWGLVLSVKNPNSDKGLVRDTEF